MGRKGLLVKCSNVACNHALHKTSSNKPPSSLSHAPARARAPHPVLEVLAVLKVLAVDKVDLIGAARVPVFGGNVDEQGKGGGVSTPLLNGYVARPAPTIRRHYRVAKP
jgi:hypothetical protein